MSGWVDRNIRQPAQKNIVQPAQKFVDKNIAQPVQKGFVQPTQKVVDNSREGVINSFSPVKEHANYVMKIIPNYMANEDGKGYQEYYQPYSIDHLNPLRSAGLVLGGVTDRYSHDYSTNQDGTPNTDKPTWGTFALDVGRNMFRNSMFNSDWQGVSQLPVIGEVKNSTIANVGAIPFETYNMAGVVKPAVKPYVDQIPWVKNLVKKIKAPFIKDVPIANMSQAKKYRLYKQLEKKRAQKFREYMSTDSVRKEWEALEQDPRNPISFNKYLDMVAPERKAKYIKDNMDISDKEMLLFPQLKPNYNYVDGRGEIKSIYTDSGNIPYHDAFLTSGKNLPADPYAKIIRNIKIYGPIANRALLRTHRDNRPNSFEEQRDSFITDLAGDAISVGTSRYIPDMAAALAAKYSPALGVALHELAPKISRVWGDYNTISNQYNVAKNAVGSDEYSWLPDIKSWSSDKFHRIKNYVKDTLVNTQSLDESRKQGIFILGDTAPIIQ